MPPGTFFDLATIHILIVNILKSHEFDIVQEMSRCSLEYDSIIKVKNGVNDVLLRKA
jgi:hypothetical protein